MCGVGVGGKKSPGRKAISEGLPVLEKLEPTPLLSSDSIGLDPLIPVDAGPIEQAVCVDQDLLDQGVEENDSFLVLTYRALFNEMNASSQEPEVSAPDEPEEDNYVESLVGGMMQPVEAALDTAAIPADTPLGLSARQGLHLRLSLHASGPTVVCPRRRLGRPGPGFVPSAQVASDPPDDGRHRVPGVATYTTGRSSVRDNPEVARAVIGDRSSPFLPQDCLPRLSASSGSTARVSLGGEPEFCRVQNRENSGGSAYGVNRYFA